MKQKMTFQKSSEMCVMFSEFFAVHGRGGDALNRLLRPPFKVDLQNDRLMEKVLTGAV